MVIFVNQLLLDNLVIGHWSFGRLVIGHLAQVFQTNDVDGPLLFALSHPHFGGVMLNSMGFTATEQQVLVSGIQSYLHN